jgi:hypothetical protein
MSRMPLISVRARRSPAATPKVADRVPNNARQLQARWDSVIDARVALQAVALVALCVGLAAA